MGTAGLSVSALIALFLTVTRASVDPDAAARGHLARLLVLALVLQCGHFAEELATGFHDRFPEMLGLRPWSLAFFVPFNLFWIAVWGLSIVGLRAGLRVALFPIWFLGIGCAANGVAHPLFAALEWAYFPGLWMSPLVGVVGILLLRRLASFTRDPGRVAGAPVY
jgi:hypothetical protein